MSGEPAVLPPSGEQFELAAGGIRCVAVEVGGGLRTLEVDGEPLLDGYRVAEPADGARGQPLVPWPNRLPGGRWRWADEELVLPVDDPATASAIHGLTRWLAWRPVEREPDRLELEHVLQPRPGWPFRLVLRLGYQLTPRGVQVTVSARNAGGRPAPFAAGMHPYLTAGTDLVDTAALTIPADQHVPIGPDHLPGEPEPVPPGRDFRTGRPVAAAVLDDCYTGLARDGGGRAGARLSGPARTTVLWVDRAWPYLMVYSGDTLDPARRRRALAVEPMSAPPGALATGRDLVVLGPGETWAGTFGIEAG